MDLSDRGRVALKALRAYTDAAPAPTRATNWRVPPRTAYAFAVADALNRAGLQPPQSRSNNRPVSGAANTLAALRRRGLAAHDGGGVFIQAKWWITAEGVEALR